LERGDQIRPTKEAKLQPAQPANHIGAKAQPTQIEAELQHNKKYPAVADIYAKQGYEWDKF
jgi:hypothetical protein